MGLGDRRAVTDCLGRLTRQYELNGLLTNVGTTGEQPLEEIDLDVFDHAVVVNVVTATQCARACIPTMKTQRFGRIVNVSSKLILGIAGCTSYAGTKAMLSNFARVWPLELTPHGITVNADDPRRGRGHRRGGRCGGTVRGTDRGGPPSPRRGWWS